MLSKSRIRTYIDLWNRNDPDPNETDRLIPNKAASDWILNHAPLFDCPDPLLTEIYYFRLWTYRKHLRNTPEGIVITEFLPDVPWSGPYNTISCPVGHQFAEGRWLSDRRYLTDYAKFYLTGSGKGEHLLSYSHWFCTALYRTCRLWGDFSLAVGCLDELIAYFEERCRRNASGTLFWSDDDRDGMEYSISGDGLRPTINSYLCGDAHALSRICAIAGKTGLSEKFEKLHREIKDGMKAVLWDEDLGFYVNRSCQKNEPPKRSVAVIREQIGFTPWYFNAADDASVSAWNYLIDPTHFFAPHGITTADMADPRFMKTNSDHVCLWDGPVWPFATSVTLTALAASLRTCAKNHTATPVTAMDYYHLLTQYAESQHRFETGKRIDWIDENLHPFAGEWLARSLLNKQSNSREERGMAYNHSTFCDLILSGLCGIDATEDGRLLVDPLTPETWEYFSVEQIPVLGHSVGVYWDKNGSLYGYPPGLTIIADGKTVAHSETLKLNEIKL